MANNDKIFLPLGMGLLVVGLTLGINTNEVFLVFIAAGLLFLIISFRSVIKRKENKKDKN